MLITEWRVSTGFPLFGVVLGRTQNVQKLALVMRHSYGKHEILQKNDHPTKPIIFGANLPCFVRPVDFGKLLLAENCPPLLCSACKSVHWETLLSNREQCKPEWYRNTNWRLFAQICAEERGDLREVLVESGALSFSRAKIVRDGAVNPCGSSLLVKNMLTTTSSWLGLA